MSSHTLFLHHWLAGIPFSFFKFTSKNRQELWNKEQLFFGFCCFFFFTFVKLFLSIYILCIYPCACFQDESMLQITLTPVQRVFLTHIRCVHDLCMYLSVFPQSEFIFYLITALWLLFTDVLEPLPLLSCISTSINISQSGKYRVSGIF